MHVRCIREAVVSHLRGPQLVGQMCYPHVFALTNSVDFAYKAETLLL